MGTPKKEKELAINFDVPVYDTCYKIRQKKCFDNVATLKYWYKGIWGTEMVIIDNFDAVCKDFEGCTPAPNSQELIRILNLWNLEVSLSLNSNTHIAQELAEKILKS